MSVTQAAAQANPSWWSQSSGPGGEADPGAADMGGTDNSFGFGDLLDVINPLQHIPVVGTLYRELTGDTISETARMTGGAVWGGPAGLVSALANTITERQTGGDIGATALAFARGDEIGPGTTGDPATMIAEAAPADALGTGDAGPLAPPSEAVARFAAAAPAVTPASLTVAQQSTGGPPATAQAQEFSGSAASRLNAFIQRASAVRTPAEAPVRGMVASRPGPETTTAAVQLNPQAVRSPRSPEQVLAAAPQPETAPPLKLATDGNTDVAHWMMRALDRYETMKSSEQS